MLLIRMGSTPVSQLGRWIAATALCCGAALAAAAAYRPGSDDQVVERLPARATDPLLRERTALRQRLRADPRDATAATRLAWSHLDQLAAEGDPRHAGYAQAALSPWWNEPEPPADVRVLRAVLRQFGHAFAPALADLRAVVQAQPDHPQAWAWIAAITLVTADYGQAASACRALARLTSQLLGEACSAGVLATTGRAADATARLAAALDRSPDAPADERLWALTRLAEAHERLGQTREAEAAYRRARDLGIQDQYLRAAHADFLLDQGRAAEVLKLLADGWRSDVLLLRLALAARAAKDPSLPRWRDMLAERFAAAEARGDTTHRKEQARFTLQVLDQPAAALPLARENFAQQKELADARLLLEAAVAARDKQAAAPALQWLQSSGAEHPRLRQLAAAVDAL